MPNFNAPRSVRDKDEDKAHVRARRAFADYAISLRYADAAAGVSSWRCCKDPAKAGLSSPFNITFEPGRVFVTGDYGTLVVERTRDMLRWAVGSIRSTGYFAEKVARGIPTEEYSSEVAVETVQGLIEEREEERKEGKITDPAVDQGLSDLLGVLRAGECSQGEFYAELSKLIPDAWELGSTSWNHNFLWTRECLWWFLDRTRAVSHSQLLESAQFLVKAVAWPPYPEGFLLIPGNRVLMRREVRIGNAVSAEADEQGVLTEVSDNFRYCAVRFQNGSEISNLLAVDVMLTPHCDDPILRGPALLSAAGGDGV